MAFFAFSMLSFLFMDRFVPEQMRKADIQDFCIMPGFIDPMQSISNKCAKPFLPFQIVFRFREISTMKNLLLLLLLAGNSTLVISQGVGIGTTNPGASAILDIQSSTKGLLIPRMTKTERNAINNPATGLLLFQTNDTTGFYSNTGTPANPVWKQLGAATAGGVPGGSIVISDEFPDAALEGAGFSIYRVIFLDSSAQFGPYGSWINMDTTNCQYFNLNASQPPTAASNGHIYTYGYNNQSPFESIIARFNPATNSWQKLTNLPAGLLTAKDKPTFLWTGTELLIWGGNGANDGYRYNPNTNSWTTMSSTNAPVPRNFYVSCFTGTELIIWGGSDANTAVALNTGARYNLASNTWTAMTTTNAPAFLFGASAIKDGNAMYVYGGSSGNVYSNKMNKYDFVANTWTQNTPGGTTVPVRTGAGMMSHNGFIYVFGGTYTPQFSVTQFLFDGYVYNTATNSWSANIGSGVPGYQQGANIQKGNKVYSFGGVTGSGNNYSYVNEIGVKDITAPNPAYTKLGNAPVAARFGSYVDTLTNNRLIFWGGFVFSGSNYIPFANGTIYNFSNNTFQDISTEGAPPPSFKGSTKSLAGKFVIWNMADATNAAINKGFIYTPDLNSFGNPQKLKLYLYQKN
jgi:N-acetylneuraminic acid mutarotase